MSTAFPGESAEYRAARDRLIERAAPRCIRPDEQEQ